MVLNNSLSSYWSASLGRMWKWIHMKLQMDQKEYLCGVIVMTLSFLPNSSQPVLISNPFKAPVHNKKSLGEGNAHPLQYSCLENSMDRGAWRALRSLGVAKRRTRLSDWHFSLSLTLKLRTHIYKVTPLLWCSLSPMPWCQDKQGTKGSHLGQILCTLGMPYECVYDKYT